MGKRDIRCLCDCSSKKKSQGSAVSGTFSIAFAVFFACFSHAASFDVFNVSVKTLTLIAILSGNWTASVANLTGK